MKTGMSAAVRCMTVVRTTSARLPCLSMPACVSSHHQLPTLNSTATLLHQLRQLLQAAQLTLIGGAPVRRTLHLRLTRLSGTWPCGAHSLPRQRRRAAPTLKRVLLLVYMLMRRLMSVFLAAMLKLKLKLTAKGRATMRRGAWALLTQALLLARLASAQALETQAFPARCWALPLSPRLQWAASSISMAAAALSWSQPSLVARAPAAAVQLMAMASAA